VKVLSYFNILNEHSWKNIEQSLKQAGAKSLLPGQNDIKLSN